MNDRGFEFSFAWLFSLIVGAVILFIGIYVAMSFVDTQRNVIDTAAAAQLGVLLHPVETNLESGRYVKINFPGETRFYNGCREEGNFGVQGIRTAARSGIGREWQSPGAEISSYNKYIFSSDIEEGDELYIFVKPFEFPYKAGDLIFASSQDYCFVNPPSEIEEEIRELNISNINTSSQLSGCSPDSVSVCFASVGCSVNVNTAAKSVSKDGEIVYYVDEFGDALIYGAIFADKETYECQVKRLMKRTGELAHLNAVKSDFLAGRGCQEGIGSDLRSFAARIQINSSSDLQRVLSEAEDLGRRNEFLRCKIF